MSFAPLVPPGPDLTADEVRRYSRHLLVSHLGVEGQRRLKNARVLVVGAGGLGSPALLYLAAAGVGTLGVIDLDVVDESNLQRQIIHGSCDVGRAKVESAADRIADLNPFVRVIPYNTGLTSENALEIVAGYDLVVDGTDNFATRYLVNDACALTGRPHVWGSILRFDGQVSVFWAGHGPCYRCLFPEPPPAGEVPSCAEAGVLGVLPGSVGTMQATEALKLIVGMGEPLVGRLAVYDALAARWQELRVLADPDCAVCGENPTVTGLIDYPAFCGTAVPTVDAEHVVGVEELRALLDGGGVRVIDVREPAEFEISHIPGAELIPKGEFDAGTAYARLDRGTPLVVHCRSGVRSAQVLPGLLERGFDVRHLEGGIDAWLAAGG